MDTDRIYCEAVRVQETVAAGRSSLDDCLDAASRSDIRRTLGDLLFKVYRNRRRFDIFIDKYSKRKPESGVRYLLYAALAEIWLRSRLVPEIAASTAVDTAKKLFGKSCGGFVNFLLRRASACELPAGKHLPESFEKRWCSFWGREKVEELDTLFAFPPEVRLTWRYRKGFSGSLPAGAVEVKKNFAGNTAFFAAADAAGALERLRQDIAEHTVYIQDPATAFFTDFALPRPGDEVLDMCAAPGGKTLLLHDLVPGIKITACDRPGPRFRRMQKNFTGTEITCIDKDSTLLTENETFRERFDYILADLPCSNRGVFRSRPDALWRQEGSVDGNLAAVQKSLVLAAWEMLKTGGILVVSTCSIEPEENEPLAELLQSMGAQTSSHLLLPGAEHDGAWCCTAVKGHR